MTAAATRVKAPGELRPGDYILAVAMQLPGERQPGEAVRVSYSVSQCWPRRSPATNGRCWLVYAAPNDAHVLTLYPQDRVTVAVPEQEAV